MPDTADYPQIYNASGTRVAILDKAYDVIVTDQIITDTNGASTLNFNLTLDDPKQNLFDAEDEVHVADGIFIIRYIQPGWDSSGTLVTQVYAEAKWYDLSGFDPIQPVTMTGVTAISVMELLLQPTDWSPGVVDVTPVADFALTQVTNPLTAIMGMPAVFGGELEFNSSNKTVSLRQQIGGDNGLFYAFGKNLQSNQRTVDSRNLYTRMRPYGANDSNNNPISITSANNGVDYIDNYSWFDSTGKPRKIKCYEQTNDKIADPVALKAWGEQILATLCVPKITYTMQVIIDKNQGIPGLGDTVRVYDPKLDMTLTNRVAQRNYNVLQPWLTTIQLSTALYTSSDQTTQQTNDVAVQMEQQKSFFQIAVDNATAAITGASGGYVVLYPSKNPSEILIMDTPDINTATKVWRWDAGGLGYSNNGYNGPYELAMTMDGSIVADFITTGILKAIQIQGVNISGSTYYMENGAMKIWMDQNGFHMNNNDFDLWIDGNGLRALKGGNQIFSIGTDGSATFQGTVQTYDTYGMSSRLWAQGLEYYGDSGTFLASLGRLFGSGTQGVGFSLQNGDFISINYKNGAQYPALIQFSPGITDIWTDLQMNGRNINSGNKIQGGNVYFDGSNSIKNDSDDLWIWAGGGTSHNILLESKCLYALAAWNNTTSTSANMVVQSGDQQIIRSTSATKYKENIQYDTTQEYAERILNLSPASWHDKVQDEVFADSIVNGKNKPVPFRGYLQRYHGLIAEDLVDVGLPEFVSYGETNTDGTREIEGIEYARLWTLLIPVINQMKSNYETRIANLESEKDFLLTKLTDIESRLTAING